MPQCVADVTAASARRNHGGHITICRWLLQWCWTNPPWQKISCKSRDSMAIFEVYHQRFFHRWNINLIKEVEIFIHFMLYISQWISTNRRKKTRHDDTNRDLTVRDVQISGTQHFLCKTKMLNPELQTANAAKGKADASRNEDTTFETRNEASWGIHSHHKSWGFQ